MRLELPGKIKAILEESTFSGSSLFVGDPVNYTKIDAAGDITQSGTATSPFAGSSHSHIAEYAALVEPLKLGSSVDYAQVDVDGSLRFFGDATVHDDLVQSISATQMYSTPGKVDFDFTNMWAVLEESGSLSTPGDCLFINYQIAHATKPDSTFRLHFHWSQSSDTVRTISGKYRIQDQGAGTTTAWETFSATTEFGGTGDNVFDTSEWDYGTDGNFNQITRLVDIPLTGLGVSAIIQVVLARTDANAASDVYIYSVDGHIEKDSLGSRQEYVK